MQGRRQAEVPESYRYIITGVAKAQAASEIAKYKITSGVDLGECKKRGRFKKARSQRENESNPTTITIIITTTYIHTHTHIHTYIHTYTHTYIHTYIHARTHERRL